MVMDTLKDILIEMGISEDLLTADALLKKDLQLDSTETVEISLALKRRLGVNVKIESRKDTTLDQLCEMINQATTATAK